MVKSLISGDEFVTETETRHESSLLKPIDCTKTSIKEDTLDTSECEEAFRKWAGLVEPFHGPVCLVLYAWYSLNRFEELLLLRTIFNVFVNKLGVSLTMNHLIVRLVGIEGASL